MIGHSELLTGFIYATLGTVFGWTLNQISHWYSQIKEDRRSMKLVLYNLLGAFDIFNRCNIKTNVDYVVTHLLKHMPNDALGPKTPETMQLIFTEFAEKSIVPELIKELNSLEPEFESSIKELASVDPLTAYYLSGRASLLDRFEKVKIMVSDLLSDFADGKPSEQEKNLIFSTLKPELLLDSMLDMEKDIIKISKKVGIITYFKTKKLVIDIKSSPNERSRIALDNIIKKIISNFPHLTILI